MSYCKYSRGSHKYNNKNGNSYVRKMSRKADRISNKNMIRKIQESNYDDI